MMYRESREAFMARKLRKQIYLDPQQEAALKRQAAETGTSEAEIIRQAIDSQTRVLWHPVAALEAWEREQQFIQSLIPQGPVAGGRTWRREDLYDQ
jgi:Ribbon-helix-helix protein, copG family